MSGWCHGWWRWSGRGWSGRCCVVIWKQVESKVWQFAFWQVEVPHPDPASAPNLSGCCPLGCHGDGPTTRPAESDGRDRRTAETYLFSFQILQITVNSRPPLPHSSRARPTPLTWTESIFKGFYVRQKDKDEKNDRNPKHGRYSSYLQHDNERLNSQHRLRLWPEELTRVVRNQEYFSQATSATSIGTPPLF